MGIVEGIFSSWESTSCVFATVIDFRNLLGFLVSFTPRPVWLVVLRNASFAPENRKGLC